MSLWSWAVQAYARPGVAQACLQLQDAHRQSVPYLLWAAWAAQSGRLVTPHALKAAAALAVQWEGAAVAPLRSARRGLKAPLAGAAESEREALRETVKAAGRAPPAPPSAAVPRAAPPP